VIELDRLLLVELVEIGITPVGKNTALDNMRFEARRSVAKRPGSGLNDVLECLFGETLDECGPLDRPKLGPNADRPRVVENRLPDIRVRGVAIIISGVEAPGEARLGEELLALSGS
jgi:hypothetical protein